MVAQILEFRVPEEVGMASLGVGPYVGQDDLTGPVAPAGEARPAGAFRDGMPSQEVPSEVLIREDRDAR